VISYLQGTNILDAGCGNGWLSLCAWEEGYDVCSLDIAENEVRESLFLFQSRGAHIRLTKASILSLPYVKSSFDSIMCINVLEHISNVEQAILEMKRVLRRNGRLIIVVPNGLTFGLFYDRLIHRLLSTKKMLSRAYRVTFSLAERDISLLKLDEKERVGHHQQFTLMSISRLLINHGFKIVKISNCRFLSPYLRSFCNLLGKEPVIAFENVDNKIAENIPSNFASEWLIVCEKFCD
jgi:2-polyprenyl-3-methyl-5-hydroxy-6-metoxy-1,4-benzoquinol methylase